MQRKCTKDNLNDDTVCHDLRAEGIRGFILTMMIMLQPSRKWLRTGCVHPWADATSGTTHFCRCTDAPLLQCGQSGENKQALDFFKGDLNLLAVKKKTSPKFSAGGVLIELASGLSFALEVLLRLPTAKATYLSSDSPL